MENEFDIVHRVGFNHPTVDALLVLFAKGTYESDIKYVIPVFVVETRAQQRLTEVPEDTPEQTDVMTNEPQLPTLVKFMGAQGTDAYCDSVRPTVGIPGSPFDFDKNVLLVTHSPINGSM